MYASFSARAVGLRDLPAETSVDLAALAGFEGVDLAVRDIVRSGLDPTAIRRRMDDRGVRGGAFPMPFDWRKDEGSFLEGLAELPRIAEAAAALGLTRTGTWVFPELPARPDSEADRRSLRLDVAALHVHRLGAIARILDGHGIRLGLEVIGVESSRSGAGEPFVARLADLDRELGSIWAESPGIGLLVDAFHLYAADEAAESALAHWIGAVVWAHVADLPPGASGDRPRIVDAERGLPGEHGAVDCRGLLALLTAGGYDGPVTVEPLGRCASLQGLTPEEVARRVRRSLDPIWPG